MNSIKTAAPAPRADDAADIRKLLTALADAREAGDLPGWPEIGWLIGYVTAYLNGEASRLPARAGSPAMRVLAAIPVGTDGTECIAVVEQDGPYRDGTHYGTVHAYRNDRDDGTVYWSASAGRYDYRDLTRAIRGMADRAGIKVVWPRPELTADQLYAQQMAEMMWKTATSENHAIARYDQPAYRHMDLAFRAAVKAAYGTSDLIAGRVRDLMAEYGPDDSLTGTAGRGIASYVEFAKANSSRDYHY